MPKYIVTVYCTKHGTHTNRVRERHAAAAWDRLTRLLSCEPEAGEAHRLRDDLPAPRCVR